MFPQKLCVCVCVWVVMGGSNVNFNQLLECHLQVWFQNQRAKVKKIQKKQLKEGTKAKDESQEESESESKITMKIKDENSRE